MRTHFLLLTSAGSLVAAIPVANTSTVALDYATFQGHSAYGISNWLGMPFAAAPTGSLRFQAPQDPPKTTGVQSAANFKDVCIGYNQTAGYSSSTEFTYGEDCLGISVQAPASATKDSKLPVMFYLSGGGYGQLNSVNWNFTEFILASGSNVIVVQANYRVAALGFLAGSEVKAGGALNAGLLDQRKALEWTNKYISNFGGDPNHVVILGGSAGAGSVALQLSAYGGRDDGLFVGAVGDAIFSPQVNNATFSDYQFQQFASTVGCESAADKLACLRGLDIARLQTGSIAGGYPGKSQLAEYIWTPVVDGTFLVDYPLALYQQGKFVKVPLITGDVTNEGTLFAYNAASKSDVSAFISSNYPQLDNATLAKINTLYPLMAPLSLHNAYFPSAAAAYGEATFICPSNLVAQQMSGAGLASKVYNYRFNQPNTLTTIAGDGVPHNIDLGAMFGGLASPTNGIVSALSNVISFDSYNIGGENLAVKLVMMPYIISFVRYLDPNEVKNAAAPTWNPMSSGGDAQQRMLLQNTGSQMEQVPSDLLSRCQFWYGLIPVTGQ